MKLIHSAKVSLSFDVSIILFKKWGLYRGRYFDTHIYRNHRPQSLNHNHYTTGNPSTQLNLDITFLVSVVELGIYLIGSFMPYLPLNSSQGW